ncbi:hypothetical protein [Rhodococcus sp. ACPA4]|uniref:hypothetical protein n=1 Tax=Rhodococcus sp. ACPA4 TaxID=2028571 RepID=UPI00211BF033|nr:hypothetical protein [Rhodococcus sp. ACPA4]
MTKPDRRSFSFEFKLEVVQRFFDSALSRWNSFVESILLVTGEVPKWSRTTMFGAATGADLVDDSDTVLICVESMGYQPPGRTWRPISPPCTTEWYVTWRTGLGTPQIIEALAVEFPDAGADGII